MAESSEMRKLDRSKDFEKLTETDKYFIEKMEKVNVVRAHETITMRKGNKLIGLLLGVGVLGIYFYSMYAVKQEHLLDDFEEVPDEKKAAL